MWSNPPFEHHAWSPTGFPSQLLILSVKAFTSKYEEECRDKQTLTPAVPDLVYCLLATSISSEQFQHLYMVHATHECSSHHREIIKNSELQFQQAFLGHSCAYMCVLPVAISTQSCLAVTNMTWPVMQKMSSRWPYGASAHL